MAGFERLHFHVADAPLHDEDERRPTYRGIRDAGARPQDAFSTDEAAARYHLTRVLERDTRSSVRGVSRPDRPELVPDLRFVDAQEVPQTGTRLVRFDQMHSTIPVFGSRAVVELNGERDLVSVDATLGEVSGVSPIATLSPEQARDRIAQMAGVEPASLGDVAPPDLNFFAQPGTQDWHLVYYFHKVPAAPPELVQTARGHGLGSSPRTRRPLVDYLVDAHSGEVVFHFSATPMLIVPTECRGRDEDDATVGFWGVGAEGGYEMRDPLRLVTTYDLELGSLDNPRPTTPVRCPTADWAETNRAAVSAHANASRVYNFYKSVLLRDGVDNKGMELISLVNVTSPTDEPPPEFHNAFWYDSKMWYGQARGANGRLVSFSRYLDVIAHELTHGLTEYTSGLVYQDQSGALNESFSDIFGIMVKNWDFTHPGGGDAGGWDWELGSGLGQGGGPLRDLSDPTRTGDPAHMRDFLHTSADSGGVHTNSNIHNKAAYNALTSVGDGARVFTPREVSYLYYLTLCRLSRMATFPETLGTLVDVASTMYAGDPGARKRKVDAIREAYRAVGIE